MSGIREQGQRMGEGPSNHLSSHNEEGQKEGQAQGLLCHAVRVIVFCVIGAHCGFLQLPRGASAIVRMAGFSLPASAQQSSLPHPQIGAEDGTPSDGKTGVAATGGTVPPVERRWRSSREELARIPRSGKDWAAAARIGGKMPKAASERPTRL